MASRRRLHLDGDGVHLWLSAMSDARARTLELVGGLADADTERGDPNTVGSVLYHLAAIEADWLFDEILGDLDAMPAAEFPFPVREHGGVLTPVRGLGVPEHLDRLEAVRAMFVERVGAMSAAELLRVNARASVDVSPVWVVHHLLQHEAEHRAEIGRALRG